MKKRESSLERTSLSLGSARYKERVGEGGRGFDFGRSAGIRYFLTGVVLSFTVLYLFYKSVAVSALLSVPGSLYYLRLKKAELTEKRKQKILSEFKEAAEILSSYINAGYSVENAFLITAKEAERLFGRESEITDGFSRIVDGIRINKPVEELMEQFAASCGLQEIKSLSEVFSIAKRTGGDLKEIIDRTVGVIREKAELKEEIKNMTAAKRYEQKIMMAMPFVVIVYIELTQPGFLDIMYELAAGRVIMSICLILFMISFFISVRLVNIEL